MTKRKIKYQKIELTVSGLAGAEISKEVYTDKQYEFLTGIFINTNNPDSLLKSFFSKFEVNGEEVFCNGFDAKLLTSGQEVSPNDRFYNLNEPAAGSSLSIKYKDGTLAITDWTVWPYTVSILLRLENKPKRKENNAGQGSVEADTDQ